MLHFRWLFLLYLSLSLSFRSLIFNFIDNVKPQPDPKGKISKFEFRVHRIVDGTGFVFSKITIIIFRRHQGPLTETSLKTRSIRSLYQVMHLISYLITHILNSTCISLTTNQKVLNCDHRHSSRSNPWNIIICVPSKRRSKNIPIYDLMRILGI